MVKKPQTSRKPKAGRSKPTNATTLAMRLYVCGGAPNSIQAIANLAAICDEHLKNAFNLEIIDVLLHPLRAIADGIVVTPSLTKLSPSPRAKIIGNLGDRSSVMQTLGIKG